MTATALEVDDQVPSPPLTPVLRLEPVEGGPPLDFTPHEAANFDVEPLDHAELVVASRSDNPAVPLLIRNGNAPAHLTGKDRDGPLEVRFHIDQGGRISAYGLVLGGWLPMPWAHHRVAFLDRSVLIALEKFGGPANEADAKLRTDLAHRTGLDADEVSPVLAALEGATRSTPANDQMREESSALRQQSSGYCRMSAWRRWVQTSCARCAGCWMTTRS